MKWYLFIDGQQLGPLSPDEARKMVHQDSSGYAWRDGFSQWLPVSAIDELNDHYERAASPPPTTNRMSDEVDFTIQGSEMQFVEIELDPGESAVAEAGAMMYMDPSISMESIFGDGSQKNQQGGIFDKLVGAGKRVISGESLFTTVFTHQGAGKAAIAFGAPYPGNVIPLDLTSVGGTLICQKDSFLCAAKGVSIDIYFQKRILTGLFGGEGFIMEKLEGDGMVFIHAGGTVLEKELRAGQTLQVDTGCVVAFDNKVSFDIQRVRNIKTALFGGEGLFLANLTGPGRIWLQSLPFSRLAGRMLKAAPQGGSKDRGEGSLLGGLGNILNGDNRL